MTHEEEGYATDDGRTTRCPSRASHLARTRSHTMTFTPAQNGGVEVNMAVLKLSSYRYCI